MFSSPALGDGVIYVVTNKGYLVAVDQETGEELSGCTPSPRVRGRPRWSSAIAFSRWTSGDDARLHPHRSGSPQLLWTFNVGTSTVEATPAVWAGRIYLWNRDGYLYAIGED